MSHSLWSNYFEIEILFGNYVSHALQSEKRDIPAWYCCGEICAGSINAGQYENLALTYAAVQIIPFCLSTMGNFLCGVNGRFVPETPPEGITVGNMPTYIHKSNFKFW